MNAPAAPIPLDGEGESRLSFVRQPRSSVNAVSEILAGLASQPKSLSPKFFYDSLGASLFDRITVLPEYYLTRSERDIFKRYESHIAAALGTGRILIEPGSGSSEKVELLLNALRPGAYVPLEITESHVLEASRNLVKRYPWLTVHAICADYTGGMDLPASLPPGQRLLFFPGSTIGNFEPADASRFLREMHRVCGDGGSLLIGVDLRKDEAVLNAAYNDSEGITARFNRNILTHVNRLADADFDIEQFQHMAFFNPIESRIEMHLESLKDQCVRVGAREVQLEAGERIHTENSYKYTVEGFQDVARLAGFTPRETWYDEAGWFSVQLLDA
ncbi:L-histidine N(alpha)-methyltransferase [Kineobactrum sediminis]|uniref:L-histidine N(Alpha)-methyltransferase n=2 Tax=Kineobactrum sediminis TaxID=1905677 RepID=A0A2N5Y7R8_9GAMM|nr:L-histidine N(alpha)-methyltransferase [Kineobactrum sediminis]